MIEFLVVAIMITQNLLESIFLKLCMPKLMEYINFLLFMLNFIQMIPDVDAYSMQIVQYLKVSIVAIFILIHL